jgi:pSer/pThr/pTyr-binding forkhead associated (FHA) protein
MSHKLIKIGRAHDNDIILTHTSISRYHIEAFVDGDGHVFITDLNSKNGTFVNGNQIHGSVMLRPGDILKLGIDRPIQWQKWVANSNQINTKNEHEDANNNYKMPYPPPLIKGGNKHTNMYIILILLLLIPISFFAYKSFQKKSDAKTSDKVETTKVDTTTTTATGKTDVTTTDTTSTGPNSNPENIVYDYSCLSDPNDNYETEILNAGSDINEIVLDNYGNEVSLQDEVDYGNRLYDELQTQYEFIKYGDRLNRLKLILGQLNRSLRNPRGFDYKIFLLNSEELNAFTAGGRIYVTTTMFEFCKSFDEMACIIGHEMYHNELGHIKYGIKQASLPGAPIIQLMSTPFNQKKETACDLHGIDLAIATGYEGCASVKLWRRMKQENDSGDYNPLENLFRSHPFSQKREDCSYHHINMNRHYSCK